MQKVCLLNLGCKVNQYEIDGILNQLKGDFEVCTQLEVADIYIVNTCAVTTEAERKSRQILTKIEKLNKNATIYVCGCASQHNPQQFTGKNGVVYVTGNSGKGKIAKQLIDNNKKLLSNNSNGEKAENYNSDTDKIIADNRIDKNNNKKMNKKSVVNNFTADKMIIDNANENEMVADNAKDNSTLGKDNLSDGKTAIVGKNVLNMACSIPKEYEDDLMATNVRTRGYIKIQDGCNNYCAYCLIPYVRGFSRSRPLASVVQEATILSKTCEELVITGINISDYKIDGKLALGEVLRALRDVKSRVRLGSIEVNIITDEFLKIASEMPNFCPQFHLSLQSGSDKVLKDMNRHYTSQEYFDKVCLVRKYFPQASITTDIIVGYPTETDELFEETLQFVKKVKFSHVHFFAYSSRPGTRASKLPQIAGDIIKSREKRLKAVVDELEREYISQFVGKPLEVLIEEQKNGLFEGYSRNYIRVYTTKPVKCGECALLTSKKMYLDGILAE